PLKEFTIHVGLKGTRRGRYQKARRIVEKNRLSKGAPQWFWRPIFVDPKNSTHYEVTFHLLLYLMQERMVDATQKSALRELLTKVFSFIRDSYIIDLVLDELLKNYTLPEDWRAIKKYIGRLLKTLGKKFGENVQGSASVKTITFGKRNDGA